uniref:Retrotransposon gag domain-containing protein n=1 Tax=Vitis vinifera TaxID=29760 RepID=A5C830_VITVI|nr:hypothetical protein VITISV_015747 [Vitis vinifera]
MPVMATDIISVEEQLAEIARVIAKLTKIVKEKDMQIASLINKVEAQVQNMGTYGDFLVKQFIRSLRGNAFDWYIDFAPECIDSWDQMEHKKKEVKEARPAQENERCRFTLKELEEKKYHFPDSNVPSMLEDLLQKNVIKLPKCKRLEEMGHLINRTIVITI